MKKTYSILIIIQIMLLILGCSQSRKLISPQQNKSKVSLKARDLYLKGLFYQSEGLYNEALVQFYQALHHDSTSPTIYNSIAENHIYLGHFDSALILLRKAEKKDPDNVETLDLMADCYFRLRDDENAINTYKKILKLNPYHEDARKYLIFLYKKTNNEVGLAEQYEQLNEYYGYDPENLNSLADIYIKYKEFDKALDTYNRIIEKDSMDFQTQYYIGNVYKVQGKLEEARKSYLKALDIKPDYYPAIQDLALLYGSEQKWQDVIDVFEDGRFQVDSSKVFPKILIAEAQFYLKHYNEAREKLLPLLESNDVPKDVYELIARIELEAKNFKKAKGYLNYLLNEDKKNRMAWLFLGFTYLDTNDLDSAVVIFEQAIQVFPEDPMILGFYGSSLQQLEQYDKAMPFLEKSLRLNSNNINAISSLAVVYEGLSYFEKTDSLYEAALQSFPDNALLLNNFSYSLCERSIRLDEALEMVKKALKIDPENGAYLDTIGWIYYKLKNYDEAEKYIKQAIAVRENSAVVFEHLGDVYYKLEKYNLAKENWQKALDIQPQNTELKMKLGKLKQ